LTKLNFYDIIFIENKIKGEKFMTQKNITDQLRANFTTDLAIFLAQKYDVDVCQTAAGTLMIPTVDAAGEDRWVKFSIIIPKEASEEEGNDGYSLARDYQQKIVEKSAKRAEKEKISREKAEKSKKSKEKI